MSSEAPTPLQYQQAGDPASSGQMLAELATFPALQPVVARNPSSSAGLLAWINDHGTPEGKAAVVQRAAVTPTQSPTIVYATPVQEKWNGYAIAGFIVSFFWFWGIGSIVGFALSNVALKQIKTTGDRGKGLATAGSTLSGLGIILGVMVLLGGLIGIVMTSQS